MYRLRSPKLALIFLVLVCLLRAVTLHAADESTLTKDQIKHFLLTAKVLSTHEAKKGVTHTSRLTLSDGTTTHDASFQTIDQHKLMMHFVNGNNEAGFKDSYTFNIAAYSLAELVGFDDMMPVYVERMLSGQKGSLSWWLPVQMDDAERVTKKLEPPDQIAWNNQMYKIRVFDELVADTDANLTNVLIGNDWRLWRVDFSRAFRNVKELKAPNDLEHCERQLFEKLKALSAEQLQEKTRQFLTKAEMDGVMARRDKIVEHLQKLIAQKGESQVLY